jgi:hypothetical protein
VIKRAALADIGLTASSWPQFDTAPGSDPQLRLPTRLATVKRLLHMAPNAYMSRLCGISVILPVCEQSLLSGVVAITVELTFVLDVKIQ